VEKGMLVWHLQRSERQIKIIELSEELHPNTVSPKAISEITSI